jgi:hypothetical protein
MQHQIRNVLAKLGQALAAIYIVIMMCDFAAPRVAGQGPPGGPPAQMAAYYGAITFHDIWADDNGNVYGAGSTQALPNPYNHRSRVQVTLTSSSGRVTTFDTELCCSFAQAQVQLPFDENDVGTFSLTTEHRNWCPIALVPFAGSTNWGTVQSGFTERWFSTKAALDTNKRCRYDSMCPDKFLKCGSNNSFEDVCKFRFQRQITFFIDGVCRKPSTYDGTSSALECTDHISP